MGRLVVFANRDAYSIEDIKRTMTVGELKEYLEDFDDDTPIYLNFDNGFTYGALREDRLVEQSDDD